MLTSPHIETPTSYSYVQLLVSLAFHARALECLCYLGHADTLPCLCVKDGSRVVLADATPGRLLIEDGCLVRRIDVLVREARQLRDVMPHQCTGRVVLLRKHLWGVDSQVLVEELRA